MWDKGKYEDVSYVAEETFIYKDRKNSENYLWASMAWLELSYSEDPKIIEYYKDKPLKNALKHAGKFAKYDDGTLKSQNMEFLDRLKTEALAEAKKLMDEEDYRKATYIYRYLVDAFPDDEGILFLRGVADAYNRNSFDAERNITASMAEMKENATRPDEITKKALVDGFVMYSDYLYNNQYADSARVVLDFAKDYLPSESAITEQLSKLSE